MKILFNILICFFLTFFSGAQKDSAVVTKKLQYGFSINQSLTRYGFPTGVLFTLNYGKHQLDLGPLFRLGTSINKNNINIGAEFNYRCYLAGDTHWFSSYVFFNTSYFHKLSAYNHAFYNPSVPSLNDQPARTSQTFNSLAFNTGYGVKFKLGKVLYLGSNVGLGYLFSFYKRSTELINSDYKDSGKSQDRTVGFLASVYIGCRFNQTKQCKK